MKPPVLLACMAVVGFTLLGFGVYRVVANQDRPFRTTTPEVEYPTPNPYLRRYLHETTLEDGTRCVIYKFGNGGGIDCDWNHSGETDG